MESPPPFRLFVIAGEASGDLLAARFVEALRARLAPREVEIDGVGGPRLAALGLRSRFAQADIQLMGVVAVLQSLPRLIGRIRQTVAAVTEHPPDLLLTVDVPDFALRVTRKVRAAAPDVPIVHWVAPSVWAWRPGRAAKMKPHVDRLLALLPFEPKAFAELGGPPTHFVGHPLMDGAELLRPNADEQRQRDNVAAPVVLVLPGSRRSEVKHLAGPFREALRLLAARHPHARFVLPAVPHLADAIMHDVATWPVKPEVLLGEAAKQAAFRRARAALAASGTVTLELAIAGVPLIGAYRGHPVEAFVARRLVRSHSVLLCNLVLCRNVAPELMQEEATPDRLAKAVSALLDDGPQRAKQVEAFAGIDSILRLPGGRSSADAAVDVAMELLASRSPSRTI